jgi:hypothetical protein
MTDAERRTLFSAAHQVWEYIGGDVLQAVVEDKGKSINAVSIPRDEVIEVVCDADRLADHLRQRKQMTPGIQAVMHDYPTLVTELKVCFGFARYGM